MKKWKFDSQKFSNLVHYIIWKCPEQAKLGSVKLHKILWKSDTSFYLQHRRPITGVRYTRREWGPTADALLSTRELLQRAGKIRFWRDKGFAFGHPKDVYEAKKAPPVGFLSRDEQQTVDFWINEICLKHTAESISDETHGYAWEIIPQGAEMPVEAILMERGREPEGEELEWAMNEARKRGLI